MLFNAFIVYRSESGGILLGAGSGVQALDGFKQRKTRVSGQTFLLVEVAKHLIGGAQCNIHRTAVCEPSFSCLVDEPTDHIRQRV